MRDLLLEKSMSKRTSFDVLIIGAGQLAFHLRMLSRKPTSGLGLQSESISEDRAR